MIYEIDDDNDDDHDHDNNDDDETWYHEVVIFELSHNCELDGKHKTQ